LSLKHLTTVRQPAIKPHEGGGSVQKYLTVPETAVYLNTSERFVRRLISQRRIAFHHVGRHLRFALSVLDERLLAGRVEPITTATVRRHLGRVA
jgi:excisionase family DNA binding protein